MDLFWSKLNHLQGIDGTSDTSAAHNLQEIRTFPKLISGGGETLRNPVTDSSNARRVSTAALERVVLVRQPKIAMAACLGKCGTGYE